MGFAVKSAHALGLMLDALLAGWLAGASALDGCGRARPVAPGYAAVVVAGAGVRPGGRPSDVLVARTWRGVELWREGFAPRLAVTGGVGDWPPAEAVVARDLALGWGVPASAIVVEPRSDSTEGNAAELSARLGDVPVLVVTDRYHVFRCERVFGRYFTRVDAVGVKSAPRVRLHGAMREVLAVSLYGITGRL